MDSENKSKGPFNPYFLIWGSRRCHDLTKAKRLFTEILWTNLSGLLYLNNYGIIKTKDKLKHNRKNKLE